MKRILIANRGEIARRVIHTAQAMGIETVAVFAEPDASAMHVREATRAFALGGTTSSQSYLRIDRLLEAARATGADAVHPGYGFLSEDAGFAQAVIDAGLIWIGPPPAAIRALGSKSGVKALASMQGVPCLPGYAGDDQSEARFIAEAQRTGYPLMVKAVAGGGGRGMRLVESLARLPQALASARSEAQASFGSGDLLIERALLNARHVEVQVFADMQGNCIHLGERDCSVQRRHQKIIEEAPSPVVDAALRARMGGCAVAMAKAAGYVGAGTVEFLLEANEFYLMEMNTRLQVEHPVTEALTGLDLVEWQIRVARGEPLALAQHEVRFRGHAIEVRLCAEDEHFTPHTGRVQHFAPPCCRTFRFGPSPGELRLDHALEAGGEVTPHYDAMLGKLIVHADTRASAIDRLVLALSQTELLGLPTNRAFLAACLDHPTFRAGQAVIPFLADHAGELRETLRAAESVVAIPLGLSAIFEPSPEPKGLPCVFARPLRLRHRAAVTAINVREAGSGRLLLEGVGGATTTARQLDLSRLPDGAVQCVLDGVGQRVRVARVGAHRWHLQAGGIDWWLEDASHEPVARAAAEQSVGELRAPFNGRVVAVPAVAGQALVAGDTAVIIESMKLEHSLSSSTGGTVAEVLVSNGQQVAPGQVLLRFSAAPHDK